MNICPVYCGIDIGKSGAIGFFVPSNSRAISVFDMPVINGIVDGAALAHILKDHDPDVTFVERAAARPGQGVTGVFSFGYSAGAVAGVIAALGLPSHMVAPQVWKALRTDRQGQGSEPRKGGRTLARLRSFPACPRSWSKRSGAARPLRE